MARHIARTRGGEQLAVSYMLLPNSTTHALVTKIDLLPAQLQRALTGLIESPEAQHTETLADVLGRRTYADSGKNMLQVLHETRNLMKMPIDDIIMTPRSNVRVPLREVLVAMGRIVDVQQEQVQQEQGFNPHMNNQQAAVQEENVTIARNLIIEAEMLEADAHHKRMRAYSIAPQLAPAKASVAAPAAAPVKAEGDQPSLPLDDLASDATD